MRIVRKSIQRLYVGRSLVQQFYVCICRLCHFVCDSPKG